MIKSNLKTRGVPFVYIWTKWDIPYLEANSNFSSTELALEMLESIDWSEFGETLESAYATGKIQLHDDYLITDLIDPQAKLERWIIINISALEKRKLSEWDFNIKIDGEGNEDSLVEKQVTVYTSYANAKRAKEIKNLTGSIVQVF